MKNLIKHYEILEASKDDTIEQIKRKYRDLITVWHPDRFQSNPRLQSNAQEKMKELNAAFEDIESFFKTNGKPSFKENDHSESNKNTANQDNASVLAENEEFIYYEKAVYDKRLSLIWPRSPQFMSEIGINSLVNGENLHLKLQENCNEINRRNFLNICNWRIPNSYEMVLLLKRIVDLSGYPEFMFSNTSKVCYFTNSYSQDGSSYKKNLFVSKSPKSGEYMMHIPLPGSLSHRVENYLYWPVAGELENELCGNCMGSKIMPGLLWGTSECQYCKGTGKNTLWFK